MALFTKILRAGEGKTLAELRALADRVNDVEPEFSKLTDDQLRSKTAEFRDRIANGASVDDLEVEAYATVREAAQRVLGQRHFDVQIMGGGALHRGMVAEMKTGEGKTLVSTLPVYLNGLTSRGLHVVTVNDYLASRDADWMGKIHRFLGITVGLLQNGMPPAERVPAYRCDVTYGTNNEFGFDYLRDNMAMSPSQMVQRGHVYGIVDEVDSILIDEARTPLIISGRLSDSAKWYRDFARIAERLREEEHYEIDEAKNQVMVTEEGVSAVEKIVGVENLYDHAAVDLVHHLESALKAKTLYARDVDYLVDNGEVKIVDEFTGRVLEGRRYSEGLHQAIEAKEGVSVREEQQTLATITLQNYFRQYEKLAGMTGTAETEAPELASIYKLNVVVIPTNVPVAREDKGDFIYKTEEAKYDAVVEDVAERQSRGQPVLLGTISIEKSERVSRLLSKRGIRHEVLNAKHHAREAEIIAQAGRPGAVTVATNMAGRGVDIMLGGNPEGLAKGDLKREGIEPGSPEYDERLKELTDNYLAELQPARRQVVEAGGLYVIGTERHDSRRIDNQLRGRSGRQGDPGGSRFYLSLRDDLMRRFQTDRVAAIMNRLSIPDDVPIEHSMVSKAVERAQRQVESQNFEIRKNVLKYDEVMNVQRQLIYKWRQGILENTGVDQLIDDWIEDAVEIAVQDACPPESSPKDWDSDGIRTAIGLLYPTELTSFDASGASELTDLVVEDARRFFEKKKETIGVEPMSQVQRQVMLTVIDNKWREHLADMDYLRAGIGLRAMGQRDPLTEYQREAYDMFSDMIASIKYDAIRYLFRVEVVRQDAPRPRTQAPARRPLPVGAGGAAGSTEKVGRNDPCPCGSGKKYKRCHGA